MTPSEIHLIRRHLAAMERVLAKSHGGWADAESLLEFREACWSTLMISDDPECRAKVDLLLHYAKDLFSEEAHRRWDVGPVFGVDILHRKLQRTLASFDGRLDTLRRAPARRWRDLRFA